MKNNFLPPNLVSNLQQVLNNRKGDTNEEEEANEAAPTTSTSSTTEIDESKPIVLVTNGDGIDSEGLTCLVQALVKDNLYNIQVCAPQSDRSVTGHAVTVCETITVSSTEISGVSCAAYEVA
ncbi:hypothetical protein MKW94_024332, partial [Papaver nudicaule]|nr:hypothetical protein [Papaver nudicaule]